MTAPTPNPQADAEAAGREVIKEYWRVCGRESLEHVIGRFLAAARAQGRAEGVAELSAELAQAENAARTEYAARRALQQDLADALLDCRNQLRRLALDNAALSAHMQDLGAAALREAPK